MSSSYALAPEAAWALSAQISPRPRVRVAPRDASGAVANTFSTTMALSAVAPDVPWAVLLADASGVFRLLCFDLDAHDGTDAARDRVESDLATLTELLDVAEIDHLVCASGPSGGRHVWVRVPDGLAADVVRSLARGLATLLPSLDITALSNPAAGCVRPPGAPHRTGGVSVPLSDPFAWAEHDTTPQSVLRLYQLVLERTRDLVQPDVSPRQLVNVEVDGKGRRYLRGVRRALPPASAAAAARVQVADASRDAWRVLLGAARACWRYEDVARLAFTERAPGLEHVRTAVRGSQRVPRRDGGRYLIHQWNRAVAQVAATPVPASSTHDVDFDRRARAIAQAGLSVLDAMVASPGRWRIGGGPADERVLRALVLWSAQAIVLEVEADIRRLAITCGISRETARQALWRLEGEGWIRQVKEAEGPHGAVWSIEPRTVLHREAHDDLPQAHSAPPGTGAAMREGLVSELERWLQVASHDAFAPRALGILAGNAVASAHAAPSPADPAPGTTSRDDDEVLASCLLAGVNPREPLAGLLAGAQLVAAFSGTLGTGKRRRRRYALERAVWAWWQAETAWMRAPSHADPRRRAFAGQGALEVVPPGSAVTAAVHAPFPRVGGRGSWRRAAALVSGGFDPVVVGARQSDRQSWAAAA